MGIRREYTKLWTAHSPLTAACLILLAMLLLSLAGLVVDTRVITGAPAWLKPANFAVSSAIFTGTMAWLFRYIAVWPRFVRAMGWILATAVVLEVAIIDVQAARGTTSHFNVATPLDAALFGIMGVMIGLLLLASLGVLIALFRQRFQCASWGWSLRLGMLITVLGAGSGGLMTRPTPPQAQALHSARSVSTIGAHTVGAPDGGPGIPGTGWSREHGDLRIPHFLGLHGIQMVPLLAWLLSRRRPLRSAPVILLAASYLSLIGILLWQALRGQSLLLPDSLTLWVLVAWSTATAVSLSLSFQPLGNRGPTPATLPLQTL